MKAGGKPFSGVIVSFNNDKGWGFIHCPKLFEKFGDVFLHRNNMPDGLAIKEGDEVTFTFSTKENGKAHATAIQAKSMRKGQSGRFDGIIVSFNFKKGYGFIHPENRIYAKFGDVFLHKNEVGAFEEGDHVNFSFTLNDEGQAHATDVKVVKMLPRSPGPGSGNNGGDKRFVGVISSYSSVRGYGFITCPKILDKFGQVFLHKNEVGEFKQGDEVSFTFTLTQDGKARATSVEKARATSVKSAKGGVTTSKQRVPSSPAKVRISVQGAKKVVGPTPAAEKPKFTGRVESFNLEKGWGFIHCPRLADKFGDVFFHRNEVGAYKEGDEVAFTFRTTDDGKAHATGVQLARDSKGQAPAGRTVHAGSKMNDSKRFEGTVVSFNREKGWGFAHCPKIADKFGDVFLHMKEVGAHKEGDAVLLSFTLNDDGKAHATFVQSLSKQQPVKRMRSVSAPPQVKRARK